MGWIERLREQDQRQINRAPSPVIALAVPWITVIFGSVLQTLPLVSSAPVMPPLGFLFLLAWRQLRPGVLPVWAGLPLGLVDDLYSGQPLGSAILLWSLAMIGLEAIEERFPWRSYVIDWLLAAGIIAGYLLLSGLIAHVGDLARNGAVIAPQAVIAVLIYPLTERFIAGCDRLRLTRFRALR